MTNDTIDTRRILDADQSRRHASGWAQRLVFRHLARLKGAWLVIEDDDGHYGFGERGSDLVAHLRVNDPAAYRRLLTGGSIAAGECYAEGQIDSPKLIDFVRVFARNEATLDGVDYGLGNLLQKVDRIRHRFNGNSLTGSRRNIAAHYDLGNDFYRLFLDSRMMYSAGIYKTEDEDLERAQFNKLEAICLHLDLQPGERVIEIGSGWGGFAIHAAERFGVHVTTTTISAEQYRWAREAIDRRGLGDRITLLSEDYRELGGQYDKLVSIEMIEAVGHDYLPDYFRICNDLIKPGGRMLLQAITIPDQRYDHYRKHVDFIQRHIFPGGLLPSLQRMVDCMAERSQLRVTGLHDIGIDYALTLEDWAERLRERRDALPGLGLDEHFYRLWQFYFAYCEGAFRERSISTVHLIAEKGR